MGFSVRQQRDHFTESVQGLVYTSPFLKYKSSKSVVTAQVTKDQDKAKARSETLLRSSIETFDLLGLISTVA